MSQPLTARGQSRGPARSLLRVVLGQGDKKHLGGAKVLCTQSQRVAYWLLG